MDRVGGRLLWVARKKKNREMICRDFLAVFVSLK